MPDPLAQLESRLEEIEDLEALTGLLAWDQRTIMPPAGALIRGRHRGLLERLAHEKLIDPEIGRLLDQLPLDSFDPDSDEAGLLRLARRNYEKAVQVPPELTAEMARAAAEAASVWVEARATSNFSRFLPSLERNLELKRRYVACFEPRAELYDVLLDDFEPEMRSAEVRRIFDEIKPVLAALAAEQRERDVDDSCLTGDFPVERQRQLSEEIVSLFGLREGTWRLDPTEHPFQSGAGVDDIRITTYYDPRSVDSLFATMHEFGHALYENQIPHRFAHLPIGTGASFGLHESQSRLWENLVGRSLPFWRFWYPRVQELFPEQLGDIEVEHFHAAVNKVQPSLIRIHADEVTYGMHVILRFELEQEMIEGRVELSDLPQRWNEKMDEYLGVEVPDDARGVLQDMHWSDGLIGYFSTYLLGTVMSVQIWDAAERDLPDLEERIERGDFAPLREWLGEHVHALGRKFAPQETLRRATGSTIDARPYLDYLRRKFGAAVPA
ncbi:MAG TPA: carboxypeptidase M32 [Gaiellaceae bacterium]|nr:carboxypeptidase M32 [Gaiellaceae bacterium]HUJ54543.1 carboxypeptidase M32 [Gaiellaceae bacterium]